MIWLYAALAFLGIGIVTAAMCAKWERMDK